MGTVLQIRRLGPFPIVRSGERFFMTCTCLCSNNKVNVAFRQSRIMKKLMTGSSHSRKKLYSVDLPPSKTFKELGALSNKTVTGAPRKTNRTLRRVEVLNTLFMEQITSLMSTGEISTELVGKGITISAVKVSHDFSKVNVYWVATGLESDNVVGPLLKMAGGKLRHELSQLRVIGIVPPIEFVKDKTFSKIMEVQTLLNKCDFGEDFVPTSPKHLFAQTTGFVKKRDPGALLDDELEPDSNSSGGAEEEIAKPSETEVDLYSGNVGMRQDILGVRHDVIMTELKQMMSKIRIKKTEMVSMEEQEHAFSRDDDQSSSDDLAPDSSTSGVDRAAVQAAVDRQRQDEFLKYLRNQQLTRTKELKRTSTSAKEREFYESEAVQRWETFMKELEDRLDIRDDESEFQDDYYIEEDQPSKNEKF